MSMLGLLHRLNPYFALHRLHLKENRLHQIYVGVALRDFTHNLTGIFEPIYLYIFFRDTASASPLSMVSIYYGVFFFSFGVLSPLGAHIAGKLGFRWMALLAVPFRFGYYLILIFLPQFPFLLPFALLSIIIAATLYWPAFHFFFAHASTHERRARAVSLMSISGSFASAIGPAAGGLILVLFGYPTLFVTVLIFLLGSALPFWFSPSIQEPYVDGVFGALHKTFQRKLWRPIVAFFASGIEDQAGLFWPIFLFLLAISYGYLGFIISLSLFITLIATYFIGKLSDRIGWQKVLAVGVWLNFFAWIVRIFVTTPLTAFFAQSFYGFARAVVLTPFHAIFYDDIAIANGESYRAVILREQALNIGRGVFLGGTALFFLYSQNFAVIFIVAALASLFRMVIRKP